MAKGAQKFRLAKAHALKRSGPFASTQTSTQPSENEQEHQDSVLLSVRQKCLNIFRAALHPSSDDGSILQEVKGHLYNRDFATAFGKEEYLRVYASRWSPSRALGYLQVLDGLEDHFPFKAKGDQTPPETFRMICIGGGAGGELVAAAAWLKKLQAEASAPKTMAVDIIDVADWSKVVHELEQQVTTPPELSKYASQAKKDANEALVLPETIKVSILRADVLQMDEAALTDLVKEADLVTFMFTLNELYSSSIPQTQQLIQRLTEVMVPDTFLLVVDSPGSYSTVSINGGQKKYPMQWLLDYTLLGSKPDQLQEEGDRWEKLLTDDSQWFRMPAGLQYPIELENMRYQLHLFRRIAG